MHGQYPNMLVPGSVLVDTAQVLCPEHVFLLPSFISLSVSLTGESDSSNSNRKLKHVGSYYTSTGIGNHFSRY